MVIGFLGLGKLGLPCALATESCGHQVVGAEIDETVIANIRRRRVPYREAGVPDALAKSKLQVVPLPELVRVSDMIFVAIQTPHAEKYEGVTRLPTERVDFNYAHLKAGVGGLASEMSTQDVTKTVIVISTVLPGTIRREIMPLTNRHMRLCYNPFFIAMGTTMDDFLRPEFVLLGSDDPGARKQVTQFYKTIHDATVHETSIESAELAKVAYNTFISMKIAFANAVMEISHKVGADVDAVSDALALAKKRIISPAYMRGGMGDGGGCHPRDNIALSWLARELDLSYDLFDAVMIAREKQTEWLAELMLEHDLPKVILGKSFKPESNIVVGSPALLLKNLLDEKNIDCLIYDPYVDGWEPPRFEKSVFLVGTRHPQFHEMRFPQGSVVIDPWRYIPDQGGVQVIRIGAPRV